MDVPHIAASCFVALPISVASAWQSARRAGSAIAATSSATLAAVCFVLFSAIARTPALVLPGAVSHRRSPVDKGADKLVP